MDAVEQFLQWVKESDNIVFFGGAGVSTESGIPAISRRKRANCSQNYGAGRRMDSICL